MMKKFKKSTLPFFILFIIHSVLLGVSFYKSHNKKQLFALLMSNIGLAYLFEYFVLNIYHAYTYKPKVIKKSILDNIFGAILSQAIFVPFTAVFLTAGKRGWGAKILGGCYFVLVEIIFLNLGVYKHHWWKTIYTAFLIPLYFKLSDVWNCLLIKNYRFIRFISLFLTIMVTEANLLFVFALFRKLRFGRGRYHSWREHFIFVPLHAITISFISAQLLKKGNDNIAKISILAFTMGLNKLFGALNIVKNKFHIVDFIAIRFIMTNLYGVFRDWIYPSTNREVPLEERKESNKK
nr:hypothetical protein [Neobacillus sp. Marseille-Q6967]